MRVRRYVPERPVYVLMLREGLREGARAPAAESQDAVVGGQHRAVVRHHLPVLVVGTGK